MSGVRASQHPPTGNACGANTGVVVQLVRIPACHAGGRGFESRPLRQFSRSDRINPYQNSIPFNEFPELLPAAPLKPSVAGILLGVPIGTQIESTPTMLTDKAIRGLQGKASQYKVTDAKETALEGGVTTASTPRCIVAVKSLAAAIIFESSCAARTCSRPIQRPTSAITVPATM
jgi:hypothetical protein